MPRNIFLVGFMASGKTRVGTILSGLTGWDLLDADDELVRRDGRSIPRIFQEDGEDAFRSLERALIRELSTGSGKIISVGGGAFVAMDNRRQMLQNGAVVCLSAKPDTIHRRITEAEAIGAEDRPMLAGADPLQRIKDLLDQRSEAYAQAHYTIETDLLTLEEVARQVLGLFCGTNVETGGAVHGR